MLSAMTLLMSRVNTPCVPKFVEPYKLAFGQIWVWKEPLLWAPVEPCNSLWSRCGFRWTPSLAKRTLVNTCQAARADPCKPGNAQFGMCFRLLCVRTAHPTLVATILVKNLRHPRGWGNVCVATQCQCCACWDGFLDGHDLFFLSRMQQGDPRRHAPEESALSRVQPRAMVADAVCGGACSLLRFPACWRKKWLASTVTRVLLHTSALRNTRKRLAVESCGKDQRVSVWSAETRWIQTTQHWKLKKGLLKNLGFSSNVHSFWNRSPSPHPHFLTSLSHALAFPRHAATTTTARFVFTVPGFHERIPRPPELPCCHQQFCLCFSFMVPRSSSSWLASLRCDASRNHGHSATRLSYIPDCAPLGHRGFLVARRCHGILRMGPVHHVFRFRAHRCHGSSAPSSNMDPRGSFSNYGNWPHSGCGVSSFGRLKGSGCGIVTNGGQWNATNGLQDCTWAVASDLERKTECWTMITWCRGRRKPRWWWANWHVTSSAHTCIVPDVTCCAWEQGLKHIVCNRLSSCLLLLIVEEEGILEMRQRGFTSSPGGGGKKESPHIHLERPSGTQSSKHCFMHCGEFARALAMLDVTNQWDDDMRMEKRAAMLWHGITSKWWGITTTELELGGADPRQSRPTQTRSSWKEDQVWSVMCVPCGSDIFLSIGFHVMVLRSGSISFATCRMKWNTQSIGSYMSDHATLR